MKDILRFGSILTIVALIASGALAWVNKITRPRILHQQEMAFRSGLYAVLPGSDTGVIEPVLEDGQTIYYRGYGDTLKTRFLGYAFSTLAKGYSSTIQTLVGMDSIGSIISIKILFQEETPGLGTRCEEIRSGESIPWWQVQFAGKMINDIAVDKDGGQIESITGATITSRAITDGITDRAVTLIEKIGITLNNSF